MQIIHLVDVLLVSMNKIKIFVNKRWVLIRQNIQREENAQSFK